MDLIEHTEICLRFNEVCIIYRIYLTENEDCIGCCMLPEPADGLDGFNDVTF